MEEKKQKEVLIPEEPNESCFPTLSETGRNAGFIITALIGIKLLSSTTNVGLVFEFIAALLVYMDKPTGFGVMHSFGWIIFIVAYYIAAITI